MGTEVSEFIDSAYTWQERAIKAEAKFTECRKAAEVLQSEVERLRKHLEFANNQCEDEITAFQVENAKLRKVADIAWNVVETKGLSDVLLNELAGRLADWETWKEGERWIKQGVIRQA